MSVYTTVGRDELAAWLQPLGLGELRDYAGIAAGMQNSNYFVTTAAGRFVLTLFESIEPAALDFYLALQDRLARAGGLPCPQPLADSQGRRWRGLAGKPAALLSCLPGAAGGRPPRNMLAPSGACSPVCIWRRLTCPGPCPIPAVRPGGSGFGASLLPLVSPDECSLLADELAFQAAQDWSALPRGVIHADLFRDNVLWSAEGQLTGLLDFYFAGEDVWLFDLAVVANDWCRDEAALARTGRRLCRRTPAVPGRARRLAGRAAGSRPCASGCFAWKFATARARAKW